MRSVRTLAEILCLWERELTSHGYISSGHYVAAQEKAQGAHACISSPSDDVELASSNVKRPILNSLRIGRLWFETPAKEHTCHSPHRART
jgi:hypothetical protein